MRPWILALTLLGSCANPKDRLTPVPVERTAYRIGQPEMVEGSELTVDIFHDRDRCRTVFTNPDKFDERYFKSHEERLDACVPKVDRASGQVQLAFRLAQRDNKNRILMLPLEKEHVKIRHMERDVPNFEFIQYDPQRIKQVFILVLDNTFTMGLPDENKVTRAEHIMNAVWANRKVFVNEDAAVAVFRFRADGLAGLAGEPFQSVPVLRTVNELEAELKRLSPPGGYTDLYGAVNTAVGPLLDTDTLVSKYIGENEVQPTVIVLTDGFHNLDSAETCASHAPMLGETLQLIRTARRKPPAKRPTVYTVGFGAPGFRPGWEAPEDDIAVTADALCGEYAEEKVDGVLDKARIDNVSLEWMAVAGGGRAFIRTSPKEVEKAFSETAPMRYAWYHVKYRVDPFYHRSAFKTRIRLSQFVAADSLVEFFPSPWFDAPSGFPEGEDRWVTTGDIRYATALAVPILGGFVLMTFLGPAMFNTRRAIFRRARGTAKKK
jgi:hypothetical protein